MTTEADTCRKYVLPKLLSAGWDDEPHSFTEQRTFTDEGLTDQVAERVLTPFYALSNKPARYYQEIAVNQHPSGTIPS